jgi:2-iminobutanoate/2-iminopropanoate deaminase
MKSIFPDTMPVPKGHYTPAIVHQGVVYISGQLPFDEAGDIITGDFETQARQCLKNMETILKASGSDLSHLIKVNVYISDMDNWALFNNLYKEIMGDHKPARAVIPCGTLHYGCGIEIDGVASVD